jgi:hypothetical protein
MGFLGLLWRLLFGAYWAALADGQSFGGETDHPAKDAGDRPHALARIPDRMRAA